MKADTQRQMGRCEDVQPILDAYLSGELHPETRETVGGHLAECRACKTEAEFAHEVGEMLSDLPRPEAPPEIFDQVASYVRSHPGRSSIRWIDGLRSVFSRLHLRPLPAALASICLIFLATFGAHHQYQQYRIENASREFSFAMHTVRYAMQKTEFVINERLPSEQVSETSRNALGMTMRKLNAKTYSQISLAIRRGFSILNQFNLKEEDKS